MFRLNIMLPVNGELFRSFFFLVVGISLFPSRLELPLSLESLLESSCIPLLLVFEAAAVTILVSSRAGSTDVDDSARESRIS